MLRDLFGRPKPEEPTHQQPEPSGGGWTRRTPGDTDVMVIFFDDIKGSTAMKEEIALTQSEAAYQALLREHDELLTEIITRDNAGQIIKSTGDGFMAVFLSPAVAVERCMEIQERLRGHNRISVRTGLDMGEVRVEWEGGRVKDVFGRHADWAARIMSMGDGGHITVSRSVYTDAYSWITKSQIAWKEHGAYRLKPGEPPLEVFEPYNANLIQPLTELHGDKIEVQLGATTASAAALPGGGATVRPLRVVAPWDAAAQECRAFAERGSGFMYWSKATLGEICYPEGFATYLQPALVNNNITKVRFVLDNNPVTRRIWQQIVVPLIQSWAASERRKFRLYQREGGGEYVEDITPARKSVQWIFQDLAGEFSCFKLFVDDPSGDIHREPAGQLVLASSPRSVRLSDGKMQAVRIPDAVMTVSESENSSLIQVLTEATRQYGSLFS